METTVTLLLVVVALAAVVTPPAFCTTLLVWACTGRRGRRVVVMTALYAVALAVWVLLAGATVLPPRTNDPLEPFPVPPHPVGPYVYGAILVALVTMSLVGIVTTTRRLAASPLNEPRRDAVGAVAFGAALLVGACSFLIFYADVASSIGVLGI